MYVYGIQSQSTSNPISDADILFYIDNAHTGSYQFTARGPSNTYTYDQLLFSVEGLDYVPHSLIIQNGQAGGTVVSLLLLDRLVYTRCVPLSRNICRSVTDPEIALSETIAVKRLVSHLRRLMRRHPQRFQLIRLLIPPPRPSILWHLARQLFIQAPTPPQLEIVSPATRVTRSSQLQSPSPS